MAAHSNSRDWRSIFLMLTILASCSGPAQDAGCPPIDALRGSNPVADARAAFGKGDTRFLALGGFVSEVPGAPDTHGSTRELKGTSDTETEACFQVKAEAEHYAARYNAEMSHLLPRK